MADAASHPDETSITNRTPFFYGWLVVGAAMLTQTATLPGQTVGVSVFLDGIIDDLGTTRSVVSTLYTVATLTGALVLARVGRMLDHRGSRVGVIIIGLLFAGACLLMGAVNSVVMLGIGFLAIRMLGQGSLGLVGPFAVNQWFVRRRGRAIGIMSVGFSLAIAVVAPWFTALDDRFGWRGGYRVLAIGVVAVTLLAAVVFRHQPERYGLRPDGRVPPADGDGAHEPSVLPAVARRTSVFWLFAIGIMTTSALGTGLQFHHFSIMAESGTSRLAAATVFVPLGLVAAFTTLATGPVVDRIPHRYALAFAEVLLASALIAAPSLSGTAALLAYGATLGMMMGIVATVSGSVYAHHFGRAHLGEIKGTATIMSIGGSALGPMPFALGFDLAGSYGPALRIAALFPIGVAIAALVIRVGQDSIAGRTRAS